MGTQHCITYLDEAKINNRGRNRKTDYYTIVSVTWERECYLYTIELLWLQLRNRHGIPDGVALHFTDVRHLLIPGKPAEKYSSVLLEIFSVSKSSTDNNINYQALHDFLTDVVNFIDQNNLTVQATGIKYDREGIIRNIPNQFFKASTYRHPYLAFREHLNLMGTYLLSLSTGQFKTDGQLYLNTKLRFDGDVDLGERDDLREAFNHCISLGTRHFRPNLTKKIFDEIRFIGKHEVGFNPGVSHAGNEITDFITTILSRHLWNEDTHLIPITFDTLPKIETLSVIQSKIFNSQKLEDNFFW